MSGAIVVTGLGTVGPYGAGWEALAAALEKGSVPLSEVDRSNGYHLDGSARLAALVPEGATRDWLPPAQARRMSPPSRSAVAAARMALEVAGLTAEDVAGPRTGVSLGTAFGPTSYTARLLRQAADEGPQAISPFLFMETVANAHAGQVALALGARGSNATITQLEASALGAVARGVELIRADACDRVLVGSVDEVSDILHAVLDRLRGIARPGADGTERARPFDAARSGYIASEGATVLVLEREDAALHRGASVMARIRAVVRGNDPTATPAAWGRGEAGLARVLSRGLSRAGLRPSDFDCVVSGASGARTGDRVEALTLSRVFESGLPPVLCPKGSIGEYGGGFLAAAVLAMTPTRFARTAGFERADPELGVTPHDGSVREPARRALVSSLSAGGAAAWMVLER